MLLFYAKNKNRNFWLNEKKIARSLLKLHYLILKLNETKESGEQRISTHTS